MDPRHLRYFLTVAETASVTEAARRLFVAQSALSAQIARLEKDCGSQLFIRSRDGMRLTEAGMTLRPLAIRVLTSIEYAQAQMEELRGVVSGRLRVGMVQVPPAALDVIGLVAAFHRQYPGVELVVQTGSSADLARAVATGELDLALTALDSGELPGGLSVQRLCAEPLVAVLPASTRLRRNQRRIAIDRLITHGPFIHYRAGSGLRRAVTAAFERAGLQVPVRFELDQVADMIRLAASGVGVTIVPLSALSVQPDAHQQPTYHSLGLTDSRATHTVSVVTLGSPTPAATRFIALLEAQALGA